MTREKAEASNGRSGAESKGRGRKPQEYGVGASGVTAMTEIDWPEAEERLMEEVVSRGNMMKALNRVVSNKGAAGVDGMTTGRLKEYLQREWPRMKEELLTGRYQPQPVRKVEIPKPGGGVRMLGIPTVVDRLIQQALYQELGPLFETGFSASSYGFRPGKSAHHAVKAARSHVASGLRWVVDIDLAQFFDRVNHDILMSRVARKVKDKRVLLLIRRYLQAGLFEGGIISPRSEGTPQGGPLSPLLSNILLDELDKELEKRGHSFCRYADDANVYVRTKRSAQRVMSSLTMFLETRLKLTVNQAKSAVDRPWNRQFLGYGMSNHRTPQIKVGGKSLERLKSKLREIGRKGRGRNVKRVIEELTPVLRGWSTYFKLSQVKKPFEEVDGWLRRKLRCIMWRQWKRPSTRARKLIQRGLSEERAWMSAQNGRGPWWNSGASHMNQAFDRSYFTKLGLISLLSQFHRFERST
ncbi:group II intron reverse transcriptase/maturase [Geomonas sp. Red51]|uniref:group II intron reverse transcriptase/maturase n=1 Tax=Geomonas azotofigens TaxID=2843196 RepID=UPI001C121C96|nr:group II intron reverse transcriptase/maturase [Geomonas azotofigens]